MRKVFTLLFLMLVSYLGKGQTNSYLGLDGGFEGSATIDNLNTTTSGTSGKWSKANSNITIANETGIVRSGSNSLKVSSSSTSTCRVFSPQISVSASTTKWVLQLHRRSVSTTATVQFQLGINRGGAEFLNGTYATVSATDTWEKVTYAPNSITSATTVVGLILGKMATSAGDVFIDDVCVYESATGVDNTAPNSPTSPIVSNATSSSLDVSWTAATGGVDGGGYMVVRFESSPDAGNDPNQNGIYAVGNTFIGTGGQTGTVRYVGTGTNFTDNIGLTSGITYYYKVYTFDKAYNYSSEVSLPVTFTSFSANKMGKSNFLKWITASESNNKGFHIERALSDYQFQEIGFVKSKTSTGNSTIQLTYSFEDENPLGSKQFYRLKQVDFDGTSKYSAIVLVTREAPTSLELTRVYPNPTQESVYINAAAHKNMDLQLFIYDLGGRVVGKKQVVAQIGNNGFDMPVAHLAPGTYFIKVVNSAQEVVATQKFIKQ